MKSLLLLLCAVLLNAQTYKPGDISTFWQFDPVKGSEVFEQGYYQTDFVCNRAGEYTYVFTEKTFKPETKPSQEFIDKLLNRFEMLYPALSDYFGTPSDLDENNHFIILVADIRDWFYYTMEVSADMQPVLGYYWFPFNQMQKSDYLTMDSVQSDIDAYGTLAHEYFHNIYDKVNPEPVNVADRAVNEAMAHYAIYLNGTIDEDPFCQWQFSILKKDLAAGKLINPFDGTHDYFDFLNPDIHHCYAAGYYFVFWLTEFVLVDPAKTRAFFHSVIYENPNATSAVKLTSALIKSGVISSAEDFDGLYNNKFRPFLLRLFAL